MQSLGPEATLLFKVQGGAKKFELGPLGPLTFVLGAKMVVGFHPCNMPHKCAKFGPRGYFRFWVTGEQRNVLRRRKRTRRLQDIYACTSPPMYLWCWGWWIHITIPNQSQVVALIATKKKNSHFIFKYRPLGPTYFNIWGKFTIVDVKMINTYHHTKPEPSGCLGC